MKKAFTIIELLLVIGIIAILAVVVIVAINPTRQLAIARCVQHGNSQHACNNLTEDQIKLFMQEEVISPNPTIKFNNKVIKSNPKF